MSFVAAAQSSAEVADFGCILTAGHMSFAVPAGYKLTVDQMIFVVDCNLVVGHRILAVGYSLKTGCMNPVAHRWVSGHRKTLY